MGPKTLNLDPDPGLDPGLCYQFLKKKYEIIFETNNFL